MIVIYFNKVYSNYALKSYIKLIEYLKFFYTDNLIIIDGEDYLDISNFLDSNHVFICMERPIPDIYFNKNNIRTIVYYDDCNILLNLETKKDYISYINKHDIFLSSYAYLFYNETSIFSKIISLYHCFIPDYSQINNSEKINKVNILGTINQSYDLRNYIYCTFRDHNDLNFFKTIYYINNNEYFKMDALETTEWYSYINNFKVNFTDTGICENYPTRKYLVSKFFEIGSLNTILLCDDRIIDELSFIGLEENFHYISCNQNNFLEKVNYILHELEENKYNEIVYNCNYIIHKYHSINNRIDTLKILIEDKFYEIIINNNLEFKLQINNYSINNINNESNDIRNNIINKNIYKRKIVNLLIELFKINNENSIFINTISDKGYFSILLSKYFNNIFLFENSINNILITRNNISYNKCKNVILYRNNINSDNNENYKNINNEITKCITIDNFILSNKFEKIKLINFEIIDNNFDCINGSINSIKNNIIEYIYINIILINDNNFNFDYLYNLLNNYKFYLIDNIYNSYVYLENINDYILNNVINNLNIESKNIDLFLILN